MKPLHKLKGELIRCLPENSVAILNEDDPYVKAMDSLAKGKTITYGLLNATLLVLVAICVIKKTVLSLLANVMTKFRYLLTYDW